MAVPKVDGQFIAEAIKYIDENGVPWHNTSTKYELVWENGNTYPPKYVIAVANHLQNGAEIDVSGYNAVEAKNYLTAKGCLHGQQQRHNFSDAGRFQLFVLVFGKQHGPCLLFHQHCRGRGHLHSPGADAQQQYGAHQRQDFFHDDLPFLIGALYECAKAFMPPSFDPRRSF